MNSLNLVTLVTILIMTISSTSTKVQLNDKEANIRQESPVQAYYCEPYPECSIWPQDTPI